MRILVTGAQGYIGALLTQTLLKRGHDVIGLDTGFFREALLYPWEGEASTCIPMDFRNVSVEDLQGFDAVAHLAELSNDPLGELHPDITYEINHAGTVALARKCKRAGVSRFVYSSSCSVYGKGSEAYQTEESEPNPQTAYARCKVLVERDLSALADDEFSPTFLRNATAYGASPRMRFDLVLNNLAGLAWTQKEIRMTSDGTPLRPVVHILDICRAIACVLEGPREAVHRQIFNVGATRENYRIREIADLVSQAFPGCALSFGPSNGDTRSYRVSFEKIHERLPGFRCERTAADGAEELRDLFTRIEMSRETFESRAFTRVKQLQHLIATRQIDHRFFWRSGR